MFNTIAINKTTNAIRLFNDDDKLFLFMTSINVNDYLFYEVNGDEADDWTEQTIDWYNNETARHAAMEAEE
jgi:hypothetical protein